MAILELGILLFAVNLLAIGLMLAGIMNIIQALRLAFEGVGEIEQRAHDHKIGAYERAAEKAEKDAEKARRKAKAAADKGDVKAAREAMIEAAKAQYAQIDACSKRINEINEKINIIKQEADDEANPKLAAVKIEEATAKLKQVISLYTLIAKEAKTVSETRFNTQFEKLQGEIKNLDETINEKSNQVKEIIQDIDEKKKPQKGAKRDAKKVEKLEVLTKSYINKLKKAIDDWNVKDIEKEANKVKRLAEKRMYVWIDRLKDEIGGDELLSNQLSTPSTELNAWDIKIADNAKEIIKIINTLDGSTEDENKKEKCKSLLDKCIEYNSAMVAATENIEKRIKHYSKQRH